MSNDERTLEMVKNMRKENKVRVEKSTILGEEIFIPTRDGKTRSLIYKAKNNSKAPVLFDVHGGGFVTGLPEDDDRFCDLVRNELDITVISIDYRLAPEYKCPTDKNDVFDVVDYVSSHSREFRIDSYSMAIGGHSAGANISTVVCMMAKEAKKFSFKCQILDYPPLDLATPATEKFYTEGAIPPEIAAIFDKCYRREEDAKNSYCSPAYATNEELKDLPPAILITCEIDSLRDEAENYAQKLIKAGVETTAKRFYGVRHGFTIGDFELPESKEAHKMMIDGLRKYLFK
ncbi:MULTISPECIES: alpha/beta hydrolase [unclassified Clostridium]|uniref:alpha/beta hydrolase n=1 Tax=unclassified Clostridium TaxID=2614128 RepID=UPI000297CB16|nr:MULTISPECIES: alpha/beta hydrolase [unclassified Clostridium]EKQ50903.1 MAG: esterase/lipase [Clostridium sp. Maddingley MBC34-26]